MSATSKRDPDQMSTITDTTYQVLSEAVSGASVPGVTSNDGTTRSGGGTGLRIYVTLTSGETLLVPVPINATIQDLKFQTLRRAAKFGVTASLNNTIVRTRGRHAALLDDQDLVSDFIDLTDDSHFTIDVLNTAVGIRVPSSTEHHLRP